MTPNRPPCNPITSVIPDGDLDRLPIEDLERLLREIQEDRDRRLRDVKGQVDRTVGRTTAFLTRLERIEQLRAKQGKTLSPDRITRVEALVEKLLQSMDALIDLMRRRAVN
jgi:hypothetical protein